MFEKIGLHIINGWRGSLAGSPCVTLVNPSPNYVAQVLDETQWRAKVVVRRTDGPVNANYLYAFPKHNNVMFQGENEPALHSQVDVIKYMDRQRGLLETVHGQGRRVALCVPSVGQFELEHWEMLRGLKPHMWDGDAIAVHEYWIDRADIDNRWHCGRFTKVPWLQDIPIIVTEIGRDVVEGQGTRGWKLAGISQEVFLGEIEYYNHTVLMPHPNVIGATLFTVGNDPQWRNFDVGDVYPVITQMRSGEPPATEPEPLPEPDPPTPPQGMSCEDVREAISLWSAGLRHTIECLAATADEMDETVERMCLGGQDED